MLIMFPVFVTLFYLNLAINLQVSQPVQNSYSLGPHKTLSNNITKQIDSGIT